MKIQVVTAIDIPCPWVLKPFYSMMTSMIQIQLYQTEPQMYQIYGCQWDLSKPNWKKGQKRPPKRPKKWLRKKQKKYDYERKHKPNCSWVYYLLTLHVKESEHQKVSFVLVLPSLIWQNFSRTCQFNYLHVFLTFENSEMLASVEFFLTK